VFKTSIVFHSINEAKEFSVLASQYPFNIDLALGKYIVSAKSIMGIFSLELSKHLELIAECDQNHEFAKKVTPFLAAQKQ